MTKTVPVRAPLDWERLHQRLARAAEAMEAAFLPSPEQARQELEARAQRLARPLGEAVDAAGRIEVVTWRVMTERFALETTYVREITRVRELTAVPRAPAFLAGICNIHGEIVPAFDLRKLLGLGSGGLSDLSYLVVVGDGTPEFGILADSVETVMSLADQAIVTGSLPATGATACLRGLTQEGLLVLDGAALLSEPALFIGG